MWWIVTLLFWASLGGLLWTGHEMRQMTRLVIEHNRELMKLLGAVTPLLPADVQTQALAVVRRQTEELRARTWLRRKVETV